MLRTPEITLESDPDNPDDTNDFYRGGNSEQQI